jgi:hypothetical protein
MRKVGDMPLTLPEIERAKALSALGKSYRAIGAELHRSDHSIKRVLTCSPEVVAEVLAIKRNLADSFEGLAERMVSSITDADILKLDAYKRTLSGAIATDKAQLLKGLPTGIIGVEVLLDVAAMIRRERDQADADEQRDCPPARLLPAPIAASLPAPTPAPVRAATRPTPQTAPVQEPIRVKYTSVLPGVHPDHLPPENPLTVGLRIR